MNTSSQSVKNERMKSYFIQASKEIILKEGVEGVSVRKAAELAGYSYATIYNYFADLNALLLEVKAALIRDVVNYMGEMQVGQYIDLETLKKLNRRYAAYYLDHPHVFRFFYSFRLTDSSGDQYSDYTAGWRQTFSGLVADGIIRESDVEIAAKTIIYALHGLLALHFSGNGLSTELLYQDLDSVTDFVLKRRKQP